MKYLLDTHVLLWWIKDSDKLSKRVRELIENGANELFWSVASSWEIAIKFELGKLPLPELPSEFIEKELKNNRIDSLIINNQHVYAAARLPLHHKDPFDRILIAQSTVDNLPLISTDKIFKHYTIEVIW
jgi:PIN domain nuclease of toxin-antitoxin system